MTCYNCARNTLNLFIRSFADVQSATVSRHGALRNAQPSRYMSTTRRMLKPEAIKTHSPKATVEDIPVEDEIVEKKERPAWQIQKAALKEKLGGEAWNPRKKLSPDTMDGIRHLHNTQPDRFTTPVLSQYFKVSPESIRRILRSKWQPSDDEHEARLQRWEKRGERIWSNLVEMGVKPPRMWRERGVGRAEYGEQPKWKSRHRNMVDVQDSARSDDLIPVVDGTGKTKKAKNLSLLDRL